MAMCTGNRIREIREQRKMTAQQLADKIGVVKTTVTRYETGDIEKIPYMTFLKILIALETTPEELLGEEEKELVQKSDELRGLFKVMGEVQQEMVKELADLSPEEAQYMRDVLKGLPKLRKQ